MYGLMWYTEDHNYFYLLGVEDKNNSINNINDDNFEKDVVSVDISSTCFGVATLPKEMDVIEAWTQYFEVKLPNLGYIPDNEHGKYFESYFDGVCELWTPVKKID